MYMAETRSIRVHVESSYMDDQSAPDESRYVWAYRVRIENRGDERVCLRNRYWRITDAMGRCLEVRGTGVVGVQPVLDPGESFEYTSGTPLNAPSGIMVGEYEMETDDGERFWIDIPAFSLDSPHQAKQMN